MARRRRPRIRGHNPADELNVIPASVAARSRRFQFAWRCRLAGVGVLLVSTLAVGALDWHQAGGYRYAEVSPEGAGGVGFTRMESGRTGITFTNRLSDAAAVQNRIYENGSGVAAGDFDGDGLCDLYFCRLGGPNLLYRNLGGWRFEDVTRDAGVACEGQFSTGAVFADVNGDGRLDLLVNSVGGGTRCFINQGDGHFKELLDSGLSRTNGSMSLALADVTGSGRLDLYVANYRAQTVKDNPIDLSQLKLVNGRWALPPELADRFTVALDAAGSPILHENGEADYLYLNDGQGRFTAVSWVDGHFLDEEGRTLKGPPLDWSLSAMFRDINGDGLPDLYVCSDFVQPDRLWINQGNGRFRAAPRGTLTKTSRLSMGIDFGDLNRDGWDDFMVVDMLSPDRVSRMRQRTNLTPAMWSDYAARQRPQFMRNTMFMNRGDGTFAEIAQMSGLQATDWSWSPVFLDVDLDGFEDILIANGAPRDAQDADAQEAVARLPRARYPLPHRNAGRLLFPPLNPPKYLYRNRGNFSFEEVGQKWGFASTNIGIGMALADLDSDGDLDVIVNTLNSECEVYRNNAPAPRIEVRLRGAGGNTRGIGARIRVTGGPVAQEQEMICGGRYLSGDDNARVFAAGAATNLEIAVTWRSGRFSRVTGARPNRIYEIAEPTVDSPRATAPARPIPAPWFAAGQALPPLAEAPPFDDAELQPALPRQFSRLGPGALVFDLDGDGWDDLIVAGGAGQLPQVFLNQAGKSFAPLRLDLPLALFPGDQTTWLGFMRPDGSTELLCGLSNYRNPAAITNAVLRFQFTGGKLVPLEPIPAWGDSVGPMCLADLDRDGELELFVGGRLKPGRYPEPASSKIFRRKAGGFVEDAQNSAQLAGIGLVSGAVFSDLNGDGWPDLILACEWGPVRVFMNHGGRLVEKTAELDLAPLTGWWNSVATGDFNNDGRPDIIAGNWGRNTKYQVYLDRPVGIVFGEIEKSAPFFQAETYFDPGLRKEVPWWDRDSLAEALPVIRARFPSYGAYGRAGVEEILGAAFSSLKRLEAVTLDSMVFLNRGDRFEPLSLPFDAQLAPVFGLAVADFDGDGNEDLFLAQNFSGTELETSPYNDGVGVLLRGDGRGGFKALRPSESGISIAGDARGSAVMDADGDGRPDLLVVQNGAAAQILVNRVGRAGRRLRTGERGHARLPIGTATRWVNGELLGPLRETQAGGGYWSQNDDPPFSVPENWGGQLWVRWPDGQTNVVTVDPTQERIMLKR